MLLSCVLAAGVVPPVRRQLHVSVCCSAADLSSRIKDDMKVCVRDHWKGGDTWGDRLVVVVWVDQEQGPGSYVRPMSSPTFLWWGICPVMSATCFAAAAVAAAVDSSQ
jgi:hypothetical protein